MKCNNTYEIFELSPCLFHDTVLPTQDDTHTREVTDFSSADDEGVDVDASSCKDTRHAREDTRFILHQTIEDVSVARRQK